MMAKESASKQANTQTSKQANKQTNKLIQSTNQSIYQSINGCGSKLNRRGYAGFGPCFHFPGFHFGTVFFSISPINQTINQSSNQSIKQTNKQTNKQAHKQASKQASKQTSTQPIKQTHKQTSMQANTQTNNTHKSKLTHAYIHTCKTTDRTSMRLNSSNALVDIIRSCPTSSPAQPLFMPQRNGFESVGIKLQVGSPHPQDVLWMDEIHFAPPKKPWNDAILL